MTMTRLLQIAPCLLALALAGPVSATEPTIQIAAKKWEFSPETIRLHKGVPVVLVVTSLDRKHGFNVPGLGIRADIKPGEPLRVRVVPDKLGTFPFHCDVFCGDGHEGMTGQIIVEP
jgi:cytochrome c oxidase subunit 2